jgi:hypothetical protein
MTELFPGAWRGLWREKNGLGGNMAFGFCILSAAALLNPGAPGCGGPSRAWPWCWC